MDSPLHIVPRGARSALAFQPPTGLANRHVQSVISRLPTHRQRVRAWAARLLDAARPEILDCGDGIRLQGFYSAQPAHSRGLVILLHGWEGCADSIYVLSAGAALYDTGFAVFRLNFRDHGGTQALNEELFHSCRIDEVVAAVKRIQQLHPAERCALVGQSLGGNFALRVAARARQAEIRLDRVIAVGPVLRPHSTMRALEEGLWIYRHYFLRRWRDSLLAKARAFPERYDFGDLKRFKTLTATTDFFVREYTEFQTLDEYLHGYAITGSALADLEVSARIIMADDDPVIPSGDLSALASPDVLEIDLYRRGGHCGFVENYGLRSFIDRQLLEDLLPRL